MKKILCFLLVIAIMAMSMSLVFAEKNSVIIREDYESYELGTKPAYGAAGWTGDSIGGQAQFQSVVESTGDNNKALSLKTIGMSDNLSYSWILYRNMKISKGEKHIFYCRAKSDDKNGYKRLFMRGESSAQQAPLFQFDSSGSLMILGEKMGRFERGRWYDLKIVVDDTTKKVFVYVDEKLRGNMFLKGYDFQSDFSIRWTIEGVPTKNVETSMHIDNIMYGIGDVKPNFLVHSNDDEQINQSEKNDYEKVEHNVGVKETFQDLIVLSIDSNKVYINGKVEEINNAPRVDLTETMIPLKDVVSLLGGKVDWNRDQNTAAITIGDRTSKIVPGTSSAFIGGKEFMSSGTVIIVGDEIYIPTDLAEVCFAQYITLSTSGGIAIYEKEVNNDRIKKIVWDMVYPRPSKETVLEDFNTNGVKQHPRVIFDYKRLEEIRNSVKIDPLVTNWYKIAKRNANVALDKPLVKYTLDPNDISLNTSLLETVRAVADIVLPCAFVYLIDGDNAYADRALREMENSSKYPNWTPSNFLSTAEMTRCMATGYDWLYNYMSESQKQTFEHAILEKGLKAAEVAYDGTAEVSNEQGAVHNRIGWTYDYSNWGFVCNGGIAAGTMAIMNESNKEYCAGIISRAYASIAYPLSVYAPDGAWSEGVGYWGYGTEYLIYQLEASKYTLGTDYNATQVPGFANTAYFLMAHIGPVGAFNFGDTGQNIATSSLWHWIGNKLNQPGLSNLRITMMRQYNQNGGMSDIIYYKGNSSGITNLPTAQHFRGTNTSIFTSGFGSKGANYIAARGASVGSHTDLDAGTFVLDALSERWAMDFGMESYSVPGYWFWPSRGDYYRKRAEGHNTLVINPDSDLDQTVYGSVTTEAFKNGDSGGYVVMDMSGAYSKKAISVKRGVALFDDRNRFLIQDEIICENPSDVWWLMQTRAKIEIASDGKSAILSLNDKRMLVQLVSSCKEAVFTYGPAEPFPTSPNPTSQAKNNGVNRLAIKSPQVTKLNMQVIFTPYVEGESPISVRVPFLPIESLAKGKIIDVNKSNNCSLDSIRINGKLLDVFEPNTRYYSYDLEKGTEAHVEASGNGSINVVQAIGSPTKDNTVTAIITISDTLGEKLSKTYFVKFTEKAQILFDDTAPSAPLLTIKKARASEVIEKDYTPEKTFDRINSTKWSAQGKQWIEYDLGSVQKVGTIGALWLDANTRTQNYSVEVSEDGENWVSVFDGESSGLIQQMEYLNIGSASARYVRLNVNGTSAGVWTSLMEVCIYGETISQ